MSYQLPCARGKRKVGSLGPFLALGIAAIASCRGGCRKEGPGGRPLGGALALVPAEARVVVFVDLIQVRGTPTWAKISGLVAQDPQDKSLIEDFAVRTGVDPLRSLESLLVAFPEDARRWGELAVVIRGEAFDEKRLVAYARDQAKKEGYDVEPSTHGGFTLWTETREATTSAFFPDRTTFALGAGGWAEKMADLAARSPGAASLERNPDMVRLCERAHRGRPIWAAAVVPAETRQRLMRDRRFDAAASVSRLAAGIELRGGMGLEMVAELSNAADARILVTRVLEAVREAKRNSRVLMLGLGPYLDAIRATADGPSVSIRIDLNQPQVDDLLTRLAGLIQLTGGRK